MARTVLLGKDREKQLREQKKIAKMKNRGKRRTPAQFFKDIWSELKKVTWPTRKELVSFSVAILVFIILMVVIIFAIDTGLGAAWNILVAPAA